MKTAALPKSKAKTAYGLLSDVRRIILAEPKRYNQFGILNVNSHGDDAPACRTVGCVAGWVAVLTHPPRMFRMDPVKAIRVAEDVLGLHGFQPAELFGMTHAGGRGHTNPAGHAKRGAAHIARFQKKYAAQLKAKRV